MTTPYISLSGRMITAFNVADEIAHELSLIGFVHNFSLCKLFFDQDHQFNNIEPIEPEILPEVRHNADILRIEAQILNSRHRSVWRCSSKRPVSSGDLRSFVPP
jgi:hypothetical protein